MKKYIFLVIAFFAYTYASSQQCSKSDFESAYGLVISHELNHHQSNLDLKIILKGLDSTYLVGWSFTDSFFTESLLYGFTNNFIDSSDTAFFDNTFGVAKANYYYEGYSQGSLVGKYDNSIFAYVN